MTHSGACTDLVASFEGLRLRSYQDQRGIWTIGYGHTYNVGPNQTCTQEDAEKWLSTDLMIADAGVNRAVTVPLTQNQFDACVSLAYNIGVHAFGQSTLVNLLNQEAYDGAANQFSVWNKTNHVENPGLTRRRVAERALFLKPEEA
jgi:lysozyme